MLPARPLLFAGCLATSACTATGTEQVESSGHAVVDQATFDRAKTILEAIDYVPFGYKRDGCYARSFYMSMELAAARIESNSALVFGRRNPFGWDEPLVVDDDLAWSWHVAPLLEVETPRGVRPMVVDPSFASRPLDLDAWLLRMNVSWDTARVVLLKGAVYSTTYETHRETHRTSWRSDLTRTFEDMPAFRIEDIQAACERTYAFLGLEAADAGERTRSATEAERRAGPRLAKLLRRSAELTLALDGQGKLAAPTALGEDATPRSPSFSSGACESEGRRQLARRIDDLAP